VLRWSPQHESASGEELKLKKATYIRRAPLDLGPNPTPVVVHEHDGHGRQSRQPETKYKYLALECKYLVTALPGVVAPQHATSSSSLFSLLRCTLHVTQHRTQADRRVVTSLR
jgi:hypothetical protein